MAGLGGVIGTVIGWVGYQVGLRTDSASSSGSLHAKIAELRTYVNTQVGTRKKPEGTMPPVSYNTTVNDYQTALNVSGAGTLIAIAVLKANSSDIPSIQITIDGSVVMTGKVGGTRDKWAFPRVMDSAKGDLAIFNTSTLKTIFEDATDTGYVEVSPFLRLPYKSSLKVELKSGGSSSQTVKILYSKE